ncbi:MAG: glycosyltransferase family 9 protein [Bryobacteraceae bacterium]|nr:glycosyltransferase family 9 protein [Bryobacteraceae bacterium]
MNARRILVVRLGSMGDIVHALPAVATLKHSMPAAHVAWVADPRWLPLLEDNPFVDEVIPFNRRKLRSAAALRKRLRAARYDAAIDFQGLIKSALIASAARPERIYGFHQSQLRERLAGLFYSHRTLARSRHVVDRNIDLVSSAGAANKLVAFPIPAGSPEGPLPEGGFVLASPAGGWTAKEWPLEHYAELARLLKASTGLPLVLNRPPADADLLAASGTITHVSGVAGLIDATRRAAAVVGIDSGPVHLAAALNKPGVAIFGPTDPERNGPYGSSFTVLRDGSARTSYKRRATIDDSMRRVTPEQVFEALRAKIDNCAATARYSA